MLSESRSGIHGHIYEAGRKAIVDSSVEKYSYVYIDVNGKPDPFEDWFNSFVSIPSWCSRDDFIEEFGEEIMEVYGRDVDAAWERKKIVSGDPGEGDGEAEAQVQD